MRHTSLADFLDQARRRYLVNQGLEQLAFAATVACGGLIVLLLAGTQIFDWYWPALLFVASLGWGIARLVRRIPTSYRLAQAVDQRLATQDTLSTALYFSEHPDSGLACPEFRECQFAAAGSLAARLSAREAVPVQTPRSSWALLALLLIAASLIGVRYGVLDTLSLSEPLANIRFDTFLSNEEIAARTKKKQEQTLDDQMRKMGLVLDEEKAQAAGNQERTLDVTQSSEDGEQPQPGGEEKKGRQGKNSLTGEEGASEEKQEQAEGGQQQPADSGPADNAATNDQKKQAQNGKPQKDESGLMDKMKNALANLLAKMKAKPQAGNGEQQQQMASNQKNSEPGGKPGETPDPNGSPRNDQPGQQGEKQGDAKGEPQGEGNQQSQGGQGKQSESGSEKPSNQDSKTGAGKQDGAKDVKMAEQLEAMGKISEIIGRRAQTVTGEMMVEVSSGKQQLKTAWSQRQAQHADAGGEIHRDEVPLVLQQYVQQYFEEVRKASLPPLPSRTPAKGASN
ncbi:MAG TPA: hypothetical protein DEH78_09160 [Solibacterales bacterium]|nr:hypothetical protein [Bryobacterales bacterium]